MRSKCDGDGRRFRRRRRRRRRRCRDLSANQLPPKSKSCAYVLYTFPCVRFKRTPLDVQYVYHLSSPCLYVCVPCCTLKSKVYRRARSRRRRHHRRRHRRRHRRQQISTRSLPTAFTLECTPHNAISEIYRSAAR